MLTKLISLLLVSCLPYAVHGDLQHVWRRVMLTAQQTLRTRRGSMPRIKQAPVPQAPSICNSTYDTQQGFSAEMQFESDNGKCMDDFLKCINSGPKPGETYACQGLCTSQIDILQNQCDTTYCDISGSETSTTNPNFPTFTFRSAGCYPDDCDQTTNGAMQDWWRYRTCGPTFWNSPDCAAITLTCAYDLSSQTIWIIVGSVLAFFFVVGGCLFTWWYCDRKKRQRTEELDEGLYTEDNAEDTLLDQQEQERWDRHMERSSLNRPITTTGYTYVDLSSRPGAAQDAVLSEDSRL